MEGIEHLDGSRLETGDGTSTKSDARDKDIARGLGEFQLWDITRTFVCVLRSDTRTRTFRLGDISGRYLHADL